MFAVFVLRADMFSFGKIVARMAQLAGDLKILPFYDPIIPTWDFLPVCQLFIFLFCWNLGILSSFRFLANLLRNDFTIKLIKQEIEAHLEEQYLKSSSSELIWSSVQAINIFFLRQHEEKYVGCFYVKVGCCICEVAVTCDMWMRSALMCTVITWKQRHTGCI